jgi:hypothetical protein
MSYLASVGDQNLVEEFLASIRAEESLLIKFQERRGEVENPSRGR